MESMHPIWLAFTFIAAGAVKGVTGMGLPTVAVSLLSLWMMPGAAAALLVVPALATNLAQCRGPHLRRLVARLWPTWCALAIATLLVPAASSNILPFGAQRMLGVALLAYGFWGLARPALPDLSASSRTLAVLVGLATGAVSALTAVFVLPLVPYLQALKLGKDEMVQALGLSFTVATLALALRLHTTEAVPWNAQGAGLALAAAVVGLWLGSRWRSRLSGPAFQRSVFVVFCALGATNLVRSG